MLPMASHKRNVVIVNTITLVIMLFANFVAGSGVFINKTVGEVSNKYDTLFAPAGYAFSIWSFIFLLTIGFVVYQWKLLRGDDTEEYIDRTGYWFAISNIANTLWLYCWMNEMLGLSVIIILLLLLSLCVLAIRLRLELDKKPVQIILFVWWPIVVYLGWIMVATIACIAAWLVSKGWQGGGIGEDTWTIIMIAIATALYLYLIKSRNLREAAGVGIWAFIAVAIKQGQQHYNISLAAIIASIILLIAIVIHAYKNWRDNDFGDLGKSK
jgi:hypothetical protein